VNPAGTSRGGVGGGGGGGGGFGGGGSGGEGPGEGGGDGPVASTGTTGEVVMPHWSVPRARRR